MCLPQRWWRSFSPEPFLHSATKTAASFQLRAAMTRLLHSSLRIPRCDDSLSYFLPTP
jgi:hypothetical protein